MAERKSALAERAKELEEAVTRLFTGQGPAPKAQPRKRARKASRKAAKKAPSSRGTAKRAKAAKRKTRKARR